MERTTATAPNPKRVLAGRLNRLRRGELSEAGRQRLREAALQRQPWRHATGPRTAAGKAQAIRNGKLRQKGPHSVRETRAELASLRELVVAMQEARRQAAAVICSRSAILTLPGQ